MRVEVRMARIYARLAGNQEIVTCELPEGASLMTLIEWIESVHPDLAREILDDTRQTADHVNLYLNGENVRYAHGLQSMVNNGDVVNVIPAVAAG